MPKHAPLALLDELLAGAKTQQQLFGPEGLLPQLTAALLQRALGAEGVVRNRRNGTSAKTLKTEHRPLPLEIPRDRESTFEPLLVPKHSTRLPALDDKILALYARGLSTRDIAAQLRELYGVEVSASLMSEVTEAVRQQVHDWQRRPLEGVRAVLWLDGLMVKIAAVFGEHAREGRHGATPGRQPEPAPRASPPSAIAARAAKRPARRRAPARRASAPWRTTTLAPRPSCRRS